MSNAWRVSQRRELLLSLQLWFCYEPFVPRVWTWFQSLVSLWGRGLLDSLFHIKYVSGSARVRGGSVVSLTFLCCLIFVLWRRNHDWDEVIVKNRSWSRNSSSVTPPSCLHTRISSSSTSVCAWTQTRFKDVVGTRCQIKCVWSAWSVHVVLQCVCSSVQFKYRFSAAGRSWRLIRRPRACAELTAVSYANKSLQLTQNALHQVHQKTNETSGTPTLLIQTDGSFTLMMKMRLWQEQTNDSLKMFRVWRWSFTKMCWSYCRTKITPTSFTVIKVCCSASLRVEVFEAGNMEFSLRFGAEEKLLLLLVAELFPSLLALSFPLLFSFFSAGWCHGSVTQTLCVSTRLISL